MDRDDELLRKHLQGDQQATRALIERHQDMVYTLAIRMLNDEDDARDATQETFLQVLQALPNFRGECTLSTWIYRIACNQCIAGSKRKTRRRATEISRPFENTPGANIIDPAPSTQDRIEAVESQHRLHQAIDTLPGKYKMVIVLHYMERRSVVEIADILNLSLPAVKVRLFRARQLLKKKMERGHS